MEAKINKKNVFRNKVAQELYEKMSSDSDVYQFGIDTNGKIYFAYLNWNIKRYSRRGFVKMAEELALFEKTGEI